MTLFRSSLGLDSHFERVDEIDQASKEGTFDNRKDAISSSVAHERNGNADIEHTEY